MEKLNELKEAFYPQYGTPGSRDMDVTARRKVIHENIEAVAEAFRALEQKLKREIENHMDVTFSEARWKQRAEAAEAKLSERYTQNPKLEYIRRLETELAQLRARPSPAADLADLVPDELTREAWRQLFINEDYQDTFRCGFSACRAAILRNIEEAR